MKIFALLATLVCMGAIAQTTQTVPFTGTATVQIPAAVPGPAGAAPTAAAVASALATNPAFVTAVAAAMGGTTVVITPPPPPPPPPVTGAYDIYSNGVLHWGGDYSYGVTVNYAAKDPLAETAISLTSLGNNGGFQPYSPSKAQDGSGYKYLIVDLIPTKANQSWFAGYDSAGDVGVVDTFNISAYLTGPVVANQKVRAKIPFSALRIGAGTFKGSIAGTTLTVTAIQSGALASGMLLTGPGIAAGTRIIQSGIPNAPGAYQVSVSQTVPATTISGDNTQIYKFNIVDSSQNGAGDVYFISYMGMSPT